jgi:soluble lytic murein transglycosylase-like protein
VTSAPVTAILVSDQHVPPRFPQQELARAHALAELETWSPDSRLLLDRAQVVAALAPAQPAPATAQPAPPARAPRAPAPKPPPPPAPAPAGSIQGIITAAFSPLGSAAVTWALRVAKCESGYNPNAVGPGGYYGLFQFSASTWRTTPYGGQSWFDPVANANAAAWLYAKSGPAPWGCK